MECFPNALIGEGCMREQKFSNYVCWKTHHRSGSSLSKLLADENNGKKTYKNNRKFQYKFNQLIRVSFATFRECPKYAIENIKNMAIVLRSFFLYRVLILFREFSECPGDLVLLHYCKPVFIDISKEPHCTAMPGI